MRLSVLHGDPGYHRRANMSQPYLDGHPVDLCITADEDRGFVVVHKKGSDGRPMLNDSKTGTVKEKKFGKVEIVLVKTLKESEN